MTHHPTILAIMKNPNGPSIEDQEAMQDELQDEQDRLTMPQKGDKYMWHTGYTVTVVSVDGAMTTVTTDAGNKTQIPTGALMGKPKIQ